ncbi:MAG: hypothetical protein E7265_09790 [Lachnospiraceae bacterium]|nr:hypothetical protein [Lachnospiraceae bacterium]
MDAMMEQYKQQYISQIGMLLDDFVEAWATGSQKKVDIATIKLEVQGIGVTYDLSEEEYETMIADAGEAETFGEVKGDLSDDFTSGTFTKTVKFTNKEFTFKLDFSSDMATYTNAAFTVTEGDAEAAAQAGTEGDADSEATKSEDGSFLKAGLNTLMGMGVVFAVLIFISFIISLFKLFGKIGNKSDKKAEAVASDVAPAPVAEPVSDNSEEIAAVIAAAIAAYEEDEEGAYDAPADGLYVRSIKKRGFC